MVWRMQNVSFFLKLSVKKLLKKPWKIIKVGVSGFIWIMNGNDDEKDKSKDDVCYENENKP